MIGGIHPYPPTHEAAELAESIADEIKEKTEQKAFEFDVTKEGWGWVITFYVNQGGKPKAVRMTSKCGTIRARV